VLVKGYCRFNINDAGAIKLSPCMPGLGQGFAVGLDLYLAACLSRPYGASPDAEIAEIAEEVIRLP
jgi:hypothetical protein